MLGWGIRSLDLRVVVIEGVAFAFAFAFAFFFFDDTTFMRHDHVINVVEGCQIFDVSCSIFYVCFHACTILATMIDYN